MYQVIAYVDGFNLYYSLREMRWKQYYWLDIPKVCRELIDPAHHKLVRVKYFTSRIDSPEDSRLRQNVWLDAVNSSPECEITCGHFRRVSKTCRTCGATYDEPREKKTDVNIATQMILDAVAGHFDMGLLITADTDLVPPVKAVKAQFGKLVRVGTLAHRADRAAALRKAAKDYRPITEVMLARCQLPDRIPRVPDGFILKRPSEWIATTIATAAKP